MHEEESSITKKQMAALSTIVALENARLEERGSKLKPGVHPCYDRWLVTDGVSAVILSEKPEGLPEAEEQNKIFDVIQRDIDSGTHILACSVTADITKAWKFLAKPWKKGMDTKSGAIPVTLTAQKENGGSLSGNFNPWYLVNVVEAIGPSAMLYLGNTKFCQYPSLLVYPKDWMELRNYPIGYLLPVRA